MPELVWGQTGEKLYETGVRKGVLFPMSNGAYGNGVAWNGLTGVTEKPSGAEETALYADDTKYLSLYSAEEYGLTIEAYMYPDEFAECDGSASIETGVTIGQQSRKSFAVCWRTVLGNDTDKEDYGYKLHIAYGLTASPSERQFQSVNNSPDANKFSWEAKSVPVNVAGHKPTSTVTIDSTKIDSAKLAKLEAYIYGTENSQPRCPLPDDIPSIMNAE